MKVCVLLLLTVWCTAASAANPDLLSSRQEKSADQLASQAEGSQVNDAAADHILSTEILFGLNKMVNEEEERKEKSLLNSFPFNQAGHGAHEGHHGHVEHGENHGPVEHGENHGHQDHGDHEEHINQDTQPQTLDYDRGVARSPLRQQLSNRNSGLGQSQLGARFPLPDKASQFRQGGEEGIEEDETGVSINTVVTKGAGEGGRKCINKVMMVEETVYDEVITCDHSYDKRCHTSYITNYESQQEEECEENFRKICMINYEDLAYNSTVEICRTPLVKDCDIPGETVCQTIYESECATVQIVHEVEDDVTNCKTEQMKKCKEVTEGYTTREECDEWPVERCSIEKKKVKKYTPETKCYKEPRELCAPRGCGFRNGSIECHNKVKTIVVENPVETCDVEPVRTCKHVTKLVPKLVPVEECADVPKEICARSKTNPRKIKKPVIKKWCYVPSKESGLL